MLRGENREVRLRDKRQETRDKSQVKRQKAKGKREMSKKVDFGSWIRVSRMDFRI